MPMVDSPDEPRRWNRSARGSVAAWALGLVLLLTGRFATFAGSEETATPPIPAADSARVGSVDSAASAAGVVTDSAAATPYVPEEVPHPRPFQVGERLKFSIQYGPIKAGTSTLEVEAVEHVGDYECYRFVSATQSASVFSTFYKVKDKIMSLADV